MPKPRINLRLAADVYARLDEATQRPGVTKSAIIEQALREYFDPEVKTGLEERVLARLDAFDLRQGEIEHDVGFTLEALGQFVLYWLTRADPLPEGEREAAHALGHRRFNYFVEQIVRKMNREESLSERMRLEGGAT
ncbi:CopG family transcriptional regulator [Henriciella mobilis]|uniref:ribbon-helix-helix domain-containing protein n=1 Tax=Henriciella mobilis TaxID=2305467 RepID=UPI000E66B144|nr:CopG family transcriptional regulator [Henriciella mobilis]RIJ14084.1 CopG family transcriptional regulator [Henriciella mobilis]RIJ20152.1 CopG family transcriptional regulator [Henriciella mobilis]